MQIATFRIPIHDGEEELENCNSFLRSARILNIEKQFVTNGGTSYWCILIEYLQQSKSNKPQKKKQVDYKEKLSAEDFEVFSSLRKARKEIAQEAGVPAYAVFTNEQLAEIATKRIATVEELLTIEGVGDNKAEKYGTILNAVKGSEIDETAG